MKRRFKSGGDEKGAALIAVLCFIVLVALITASAVTISQIGNYTSRTFTDRSLSAYLAEGAAARIQWMILADKRKYTNRILGETDYSAELEERYLADGVVHKMDYYGNLVEVTIYDMATGYDISDENPAKGLESYKSTLYDDPDKRDFFAGFMDCLKDYVDADDFPQLKGMEKDDYSKKGLYPLPRNAKLQFREEIMLVPGFEKFFSPDASGRLSSFRIIPPQNLPKIGQNSSFFSASREYLMSKGSLSSDQADKVIAARELWKNERVPLSQNLDPKTLAMLKGGFSFSESGAFTIVVNASPGLNRVRRTLAVSMQIPANISLPGIRYYEYILY